MMNGAACVSPITAPQPGQRFHAGSSFAPHSGQKFHRLPVEVVVVTPLTWLFSMEFNLNNKG